MPLEIRRYSLEEAEALPVFMEPQHDQLIVAGVSIEGQSGIWLPETAGADDQLVYLVLEAGPGRMRADGERVPMDYKKGDLVHMSGRQVVSAFDYHGYVIYVASAQSVAARINREKLFEVIARAKKDEFKPKDVEHDATGAPTPTIITP